MSRNTRRALAPSQSWGTPGGAGSNVWMLADWSDSDYNVNPYLPLADAQRDAPLLAIMARIAAQLSYPFGYPH